MSKNIRKVVKTLRKKDQQAIKKRAAKLIERERQFQEIRETYSGLNEKELALMRKESLLLDQASGDGIK